MTIQEYLNGTGMEFWRQPMMLVVMAFAEWACFLYYIHPTEYQGRPGRKQILVDAGFAGAATGLQLMHARVGVHSLAYLVLWIVYMICVTDRNWKNALLEGGIFCLYIEFSKLVCRDGALAYQLKRLFPELSGNILNGGMVCLYLLFLCLGIRWVRRQLAYLEQLELNFWQVVSQLLPLVCYLLVRQFQFHYMESLTGGAWLWLNALQIFIVGCAEFAIMTTARMLSAEQEKAELLKREMLLEKQREQYRVQETAIEAVKHRYHDLKHYLAALETMGQEEQNASLQALRREIEPYERIQKTGNEILDILLAERIAECQKKNIRLVPFVDGRQTQFISTMDLCAIFGNAMDNAIEASARLTYVNMREISVKIGVSGEMLLMRFQNYFDGELAWVGDRIRTSKEDGENHGYGLQNIGTIVGRYGGTVACETEGQEFALHILIPLP